MPSALLLVMMSSTSQVGSIRARLVLRGSAIGGLPSGRPVVDDVQVLDTFIDPRQVDDTADGGVRSVHDETATPLQPLSGVDQEADAGAIHEGQLRRIKSDRPTVIDRRSQRLFEGLDRAEVEVTSHDDRARHGLVSDPERPLNQLDLRGLGRIDDAENARGSSSARSVPAVAANVNRVALIEVGPGGTEATHPWIPLGIAATPSREIGETASPVGHREPYTPAHQQHEPDHEQRPWAPRIHA